MTSTQKKQISVRGLYDFLKTLFSYQKSRHKIVPRLVDVSIQTPLSRNRRHTSIVTQSTSKGQKVMLKELRVRPRVSLVEFSFFVFISNRDGLVR